jgi:hypothetical protein
LKRHQAKNRRDVEDKRERKRKNGHNNATLRDPSRPKHTLHNNTLTSNLKPIYLLTLLVGILPVLRSPQAYVANRSVHYSGAVRTVSRPSNNGESNSLVISVTGRQNPPVEAMLEFRLCPEEEGRPESHLLQCPNRRKARLEEEMTTDDGRGGSGVASEEKKREIRRRPVITNEEQTWPDRPRTGHDECLPIGGGEHLDSSPDHHFSILLLVCLL